MAKYIPFLIVLVHFLPLPNNTANAANAPLTREQKIQINAFAEKIYSLKATFHSFLELNENTNTPLNPQLINHLKKNCAIKKSAPVFEIGGANCGLKYLHKTRTMTPNESKEQLLNPLVHSETFQVFSKKLAAQLKIKKWKISNYFNSHARKKPEFKIFAQEHNWTVEDHTGHITTMWGGETDLSYDRRSGGVFVKKLTINNGEIEATMDIEVLLGRRGDVRVDSFEINSEEVTYADLRSAFGDHLIGLPQSNKKALDEKMRVL